MKRKICTKCKKNLPFSAFGKHPKGFLGLQSQCRSCQSKQKLQKYYLLGPRQKREFLRVIGSRVKTYRTRKLRRGICAYCTQPLVKGTQSCHVHLRHRREKAKHARGLRKKRGICVRCGLGKRMQPFRLCASCRRASSESNRLLHEQVIQAYGSKCQCCGEQEVLFLSVDHIYNDGNKHRRLLKSGRIPGQSFYPWLKRHGYPKDRFQALCYNCNWGKHRNGGVCPHKSKV